MPILIKDIQRNSNEIIRIEISEFKGKELINIRIWYQAIDNATGDVIFKPTQKGVTLNVAEFDQLKDGIDKLANYISDKKEDTVPDQPLPAVPSEYNEDEEDDDDEEKKDQDEKKE